MNMKRIYRKIQAFVLAAALTLSLASCGQTGDNEGDNQQGPGGETQQQQQIGVNGYVYVPEFIDLASGEGERDISEFQMQGEYLYYRSYFWDEENEKSGYKYYRRNVNTGESAELPLAFDMEGMNSWWPVGGLFFDDEGNITSLTSVYSYSEEREDYSQFYWLYRFDSEGNLLEKKDLTEALTLDSQSEDYGGVQQVAIDQEQRVYAVISGGERNAVIIVLDAEGEKLAQIDTGSNWLNGIAAMENGKVLVTRYGNTGTECLEVDLAGKTLSAAHSGMPSSYNSDSLQAGPDGSLLVNDGSRLWKYNLDTDESEEILVWTDCDINGSYVRMTQALEDGRIAVYSQNWSDNTQELAFLTRKEVSEVPQKQIITIATLWSSQDLQEAVVKFNKQSDTYRVRINTYWDDNTEWSENKYQDAITALNNSITSSNCPDIIDLTYGNMNSYLAKGLLTDLAPYLEKSSTVKREELMESVLNAYTYDGVLVSIPTSFSVRTIMGRTSQLGNRTSWTIKDIMEFAAEYPQSRLFGYSSKSSMLSTCLLYSADSFIDYNTGKCSFDSEDFQDILEFCNTFETETEYDREGDSIPKQIADGRILLEDISISDMEYMQMYALMFNEPITFIGYPTVDGSGGNRLYGQHCYAITTKSANPEGAWAFIESMLVYSPQPEWGGYGGLSIRKDMLEEYFAKAMEENMLKDENGDPILDENGEPIINPKTSWGYDDFTAEIYAATPEQVQMVRDLIDSAVASTNNDETIIKIITEEAEGYFEGQRTVADVCGVIQSRVQIYVSENR